MSGRRGWKENRTRGVGAPDRGLACRCSTPGWQGSRDVSAAGPPVRERGSDRAPPPGCRSCSSSPRFRGNGSSPDSICRAFRGSGAPSHGRWRATRRRPRSSGTGRYRCGGSGSCGACPVPPPGPCRPGAATASGGSSPFSPGPAPSFRLPPTGSGPASPSSPGKERGRSSIIARSRPGPSGASRGGGSSGWISWHPSKRSIGSRSEAPPCVST